MLRRRIPVGPGRRARRRHAARTMALAVLLVAGRPAGAPRSDPARPAPAPPPEAADAARRVLDMAESFVNLVRDTLPLLEANPDATTLWAALYDTRLVAAEVDRLTANVPIFQASTGERNRLQDLAAEAHLQLALFETHGLDFEKARQEIGRAKALSDGIQTPDYRIEWTALQEKTTGRGMVTRYQLLSLPEFEAALGGLWTRSRLVHFEFSGYAAAELLGIGLERSPQPVQGSLDDRLLARAAAMLREALIQGKRTFDMPLTPGVYSLSGARPGELKRGFIVPEVSEVDPVVVDRARFTLRIDPKPGPKGPWLFLNGILMSDLTTMPYGVYRIKVDASYYQGAPEVVRFVLGEGISDKTRTSWTLYVPGGGGVTMMLDRTPLGDRLFRK